MCVSPIKLNNGTLARCRQCWQCRSADTHDWVGRCVAEKLTSKACHAVTLTYGFDDKVGSTDHLHARILHYKDVQLFLKSLRKDYNVRYLVAGEYGSKKGRAHWHILLYWQNDVPPEIVLRKNVSWDYWPHGYVFFDQMSIKAIRYTCKYIRKGNDEHENSYFQFSRRPELGAKYFEERARNYARQGLAPRDLYYRIQTGGTQYPDHKMRGSVAKNFLDWFVYYWVLEQPGRPIPASTLVEEHIDRCHRDMTNYLFNPVHEEALLRDKHRTAAKAPKTRVTPFPNGHLDIYQMPPGWDQQSFNWLAIPFDPVEKLYWVWYVDRRYYWSHNPSGEKAWTSTIRDEKGVARNAEPQKRLSARNEFLGRKAG